MIVSRADAVCYALSSNLAIEYAFLWFLKHVARVEVLLICHDVVPFVGPGEDFADMVRRRRPFYALADRLIVHNENSIEDLSVVFGISRDKVRQFPFPIYDTSAMGFREIGRLPALFANAVVDLQPGAVAPQVVESAAGFHMVKLVARRAAPASGPAAAGKITQTQVRHILIRTGPNMPEAEARRQLSTLRDRITHGGDFADAAKRFSQDGSAQNGGDLGWAGRGTFVPEFDSKREVIGLIVVASDITKHKEIEAELKQAKEAAEVANATKSAFLANMSHEIRTPLGAVLGFSELLATGELPASERVNSFEVIRRNGRLLSNVINDILDLSKVEAGKLEVETCEAPFAELKQFAYQIQNGVRAADEAARRADVYPGTRRDILQRYRLDYDAWTR